jgi:hypothetical protein
MSTSLATEQEWNRLRKAYSVSLMAETPLSSLAQNLEAGDWPLEGSDETPSKYVVFSWSELQQLPAFASQPVLLELLLRVLNDTLAFDEPFEEMVETSQKSITAEYSAIKTLGKLQIPEEFPIALTALSAEAKDLCSSQGFQTLGEYVRLSQKISQLVIMEGDFRSFLNAISHVDEVTIAKFLPFRPGTKGLHLAEAIGGLLRAIPEAELCAMAKLQGFRGLTAEQTALAAAVSKGRLSEVQQQFGDNLRQQLNWFSDQAQEWRANQAGNQSLTYRLRVLNDPMREAVALGLIQGFFSGPPAATQAAPTLSPAAASAPSSTPAASAADSPSLWRRFLRIFGK